MLLSYMDVLMKTTPTRYCRGLGKWRDGIKYRWYVLSCRDSTVCCKCDTLFWTACIRDCLKKNFHWINKLTVFSLAGFSCCKWSLRLGRKSWHPVESLDKSSRTMEPTISSCLQKHNPAWVVTLCKWPLQTQLATFLNHWMADVWLVCCP